MWGAVTIVKPKILAEPPLIGRERELEELMRSLDSILKGNGTTVFISGEAGTGKTRFVNEFLSLAKQKIEIATLVGWCLSNAKVPFFPFIEAFNAYFGARKSEAEYRKETEEESELKAWLTGQKRAEISGKLENLTPQAIKDLTFAAITRALLSISTKKPTILFIDDLHWADSASLALLHYISRFIANERVLVLATFRNEELIPDGEGRQHPLVEALRLMRREDLFKEIKLQHLNQTSVSAIAERMVGGSLTPEFAEKLAEESHGNPLFVIESLRMLSERRGLVEENGRWRLSIDEFGIPAKVKDIILRRVETLKPAQRRVLDLASVIGEKFNVELLGAVLGQDNLEVLETLNSVARSSSLVVCEGDFYRFDHDKSKEALYEEISPPLRRGYHVKIAEQLETIGKDPEKLRVNDLAFHYYHAGNREKSIKYALAAGNDALEKSSNEEAIKHFTQVLQLIGEDAIHFDERTGALEGLGDAFFAKNMFEEATKTFEQLANIATGVLRLRAFRKAMDATFFKGDIPHLKELIEKANECATVDRLECARIQMNKGRTMVTTNPALALENYEEALRVFEEEYSLWDIAWVLVAVGIMRSMVGKLKEGLAASLRSITLFDEVGDPGWQMEAYTVAGQNFLLCLLSEKANELYVKSVEINEKMKLGDYGKLVQIAILQAEWLENMDSDLAGALSLGLRALEYLRKTESDRYAVNVYTTLIRLYTKLGDMKHAEDYFKKVMSLSPQKRWIFPHLAGAIFFSGKKQWKKANHLFKESLKALKAPHLPVAELIIRSDFAWALESQGRREEARKQRKMSQKATEKIRERFEHINLQTSLIAPIRVEVGQTFEARLDLINVSKDPCTIVKVENVVPPEFKLTSLTADASPNPCSLDMQKRKISPFQIETLKLGLQATEAGIFILNPEIVYIEDLRNSKTCKPTPVAITVRQAQPTFEVLPDRVTTGFSQLDALLYGGIPKNCAVLLESPAIDERRLISHKFLEAGVRSGQITFYMTIEPGNVGRLAEEQKSNFFLIVCNPQADNMIGDLPNVSKLKGVENLTEIDIAFAKVFRNAGILVDGPRRMCIELVSDVLLQHHALTTRKWLSGFLANLRSKGFTTLAMIDPTMHPVEEVQAVLGLFDGEIRISEKETAMGNEKTLRIRRLHNHKFLKNELVLNREKLKKALTI